MADPMTELVNLLSSLDTFVAIVTIISALVPLTLIPIIQWLMRRQERNRKAKEKEKVQTVKDLVNQDIKEKQIMERLDNVTINIIPPIQEDIQDIKGRFTVGEDRFRSIENNIKEMGTKLSNLDTDLSVLNAIVNENRDFINNSNVNESISGRKRKTLK